jgi:flavin reductase (DIM6/NTAB) family NADH-FMN oxidoreductase RutF
MTKELTLAELAGLPGIEPNTFWRALAPRAVGAAVVTAQGATGPAGFLALSATHLTSEPPILMVSIGNSTSAVSAILEAGHFAVNYLARPDQSLADVFGGKSDLKAANRFEPALWTTLATGAPVLKRACGALDCVLVETVERFRTTIALGRIVAATDNPGCDPLIHFRGAYL